MATDTSGGQRQPPGPGQRPASAARQGIRISLSVKLLAALGLVVVVSLAAVALTARWTAVREFTDFMQQRQMLAADDLAAQLALYYSQYDGWAGVERVLRQNRMGMKNHPPGINWMLADPQSSVVADSWGERAGDQLSRGDLATGRPVQVGGETVGILIVIDDGRPNPEVMRRGLTPEGTATLDRVQRSILIASLGAGAVALAVGGLLAWGLVRPLRRLTAAAEAVAGGDLSQRVPVASGDEVGELAAAFNHMAAELERAEQLRRDLTADVAHELRTPLSVIRSHVEALQDGVFDLTPDNLGPIHDKILLLGRLVEDLRELALADAGQLPLECGPTDLRTLVESTLRSFRAQAEAEEVSLRAELPPELPLVHADRERIGQVLTNLMSNALRHTAAGGTITLSATEAAGSRSAVRLSVADTGEGIAPADLPYVFERLYRSDRARARSADDQGTGLGLAIARGIVEAHGGTIEVESELGDGAVFSFCLPVHPE